MKKSLIAIAALAAAGAAAAQSSVTMYGQVNTGYEYSKTDITLSGVKTTTKTTGFQNDRVNISRLGFKGEEALGNGLSATFALEMGFDSADGKFAESAFNRKATVGLKGAFGEVRVGKDSGTMNSFDGSFKAIDRTDSLAKIDDPDGIGPKVDLDAAYTARPTGLFYDGSFFGVNVSAAIGNDSERVKTAGVTTDKQDTAVYGLGLGYNGGAWAVGAAFQHETKKGPATTITLPTTPPVTWTTPAYDKKVTNYGVGASYDFTVAKLYGQYKGGQYKNELSAGGKYSYDQFAIGVSAPFGATTLSAEYGYNKAKETAATTGTVTKFKGNVFAVQAEYAFSKRTSLVARAGQVANWKNETTNDKSSTQEYTVGLRHKF